MKRLVLFVAALVAGGVVNSTVPASETAKVGIIVLGHWNSRPDDRGFAVAVAGPDNAFTGVYPCSGRVEFLPKVRFEEPEWLGAGWPTKGDKDFEMKSRAHWVGVRQEVARRRAAKCAWLECGRWNRQSLCKVLYAKGEVKIEGAFTPVSYLAVAKSAGGPGLNVAVTDHDKDTKVDRTTTTDGKLGFSGGVGYSEEKEWNGHLGFSYESGGESRVVGETREEQDGGQVVQGFKVYATGFSDGTTQRRAEIGAMRECHVNGGRRCRVWRVFSSEGTAVAPMTEFDRLTGTIFLENTGDVEFLLRQGVGDHVVSMALHQAVAKNSTAITQLLLSNARPRNLYYVDMHGNMPLHTAIINGHVGMVRLLLRAGANAGQVGWGGLTALQIAVLKAQREGDLELLRVLLEASSATVSHGRGRRLAVKLNHGCRYAKVVWATLRKRGVLLDLAREACPTIELKTDYEVIRGM